MNIDPEATDRLVELFIECEQRGIAVPEDMPLDTPDHQRCGVVHLSRLIAMDKGPK